MANTYEIQVPFTTVKTIKVHGVKIITAEGDSPEEALLNLKNEIVAEDVCEADFNIDAEVSTEILSEEEPVENWDNAEVYLDPTEIIEDDSTEDDSTEDDDTEDDEDLGLSVEDAAKVAIDKYGSVIEALA